MQSASLDKARVCSAHTARSHISPGNSSSIGLRRSPPPPTLFLTHLIIPLLLAELAPDQGSISPQDRLANTSNARICDLGYTTTIGNNIFQTQVPRLRERRRAPRRQHDHR